MRGAKCKIDTVLPDKSLVLLDPLVASTRCFFMAGVSPLFAMDVGSECSEVKLFPGRWDCKERQTKGNL